MEDTEAGAGGQRMENMVWTALFIQVLNKRAYFSTTIVFFKDVNLLATKKWPLDGSITLENKTVHSHYVNICIHLV